MKKLINIALFFMGCLFVTSCGEDNTEVPLHGLKVLSSKTNFGPLGGTNKIAVADQAVKAYSPADWLSVSTAGSEVSVTASENNALTSRHSTVVIKSSELDSTIVSVSQIGKVLSVTGMPKAVNVENDGATLEYEANANSPLQLTCDSSWAQASYAKGKISIDVAENNSGHLRSCYVKYGNGLVKDSVYVVQYNLEENILGKYILQGIDPTNPTNDKYPTLTFNSELVKNGSKIELKVDAFGGLTIPVTFEPSYPYIKIDAGSWIGKYYDSYLALFLVNENGYFTHSNSYYLAGLVDYSAKYSEKDDRLEGTALMFVGSSGYSYLNIESYMEQEYTSDYDEGSVLQLANMGLYRLKDQTTHE